MNSLALELTRLIGKKELEFGCLVEITRDFETDLVKIIGKYGDRYSVVTYSGIANGLPESEFIEIIGHPATLSDLHRWFNINNIDWNQGYLYNQIIIGKNDDKWFIEYNSSKELLDQSEETLKQLIEFITSYQ